MEISSTPPKDTFFPKIVFIVCCSLVVIGGAFMISNYILPKNVHTSVNVASPTLNENEGTMEENIPEPVSSTVSTTEEDLCAFFDAFDDNNVFIKDRQIVACQGRGNLVLSGIHLTDKQTISTVKDFDFGYTYFISVFEDIGELANYVPVKSFFYSRGKFTEVENKTVSLSMGDCSAYDYGRQRIFKWFCGGEGSITNSGVPVSMQDIRTGETTILISPEDLGLTEDNWTYSSVWYGRGILSAFHRDKEARDKIIVYDFNSDVLEPMVFMK